jgi:hypothetical protein
LSEFARINAALDNWDQDIQITIDVFLQGTLHILITESQGKKTINDRDQAKQPDNVPGDRIGQFPNCFRCAGFCLLQVF